MRAETRAPGRKLRPGARDGAGDGIRTRDTKLGKLVLYQLSYARTDDNVGAVAPKSPRFITRQDKVGKRLSLGVTHACPPPQLAST
jgi:hypothetical protein